MPPRDLRWVEIRDFRPGIRELVTADVQTPGSCTPNTYGCRARPDGALEPLPALTYTYTFPSLPFLLANVQNGKAYISGFHVTGPLSGAAVASGQQNEFHIAWDWIATTGVPNPHREYRWERHQMFANPIVIDTVVSLAGAGTPTASTRGTFFQDVRMDPTTATNPGVPLVAGAWYEEGGGGNRFVRVFPAPATPALNSNLAISTTLPCDIIAAHQGRLMMFEQRGWNHGNPGSWISNEQVWFTNVNLPTIEPSVAQTYSVERMTGIGAVKTVSASELLIVKFDEGGLTLHGDVANPTIFRLPGVHPTFGATTIPVYSPLGLVYGSLNSGVHVWGGGDSSQCISDFLAPDFWQVSGLDRWLNYHGKFAFWHDLICVPNSYLFDTTTNSWWRFQETGLFHYATDYAGALFATKDSYVGPNGTEIVYGWDYNTRENNYYWESNFFPIAAPGQRATIREVVIEVTGFGDVSIVIESGEPIDVDSQPSTFEVGAVFDLPTQFRQQCAIRTTDHVRLKVNAIVGGGEAPTIFSIKLGISDDAVHI